MPTSPLRSAWDRATIEERRELVRLILDLKADAPEWPTFAEEMARGITGIPSQTARDLLTQLHQVVYARVGRLAEPTPETVNPSGIIE